MDMEGKLMRMEEDQQRAKLGDDGVTTAAKQFMFTYYEVCS